MEEPRIEIVPTPTAVEATALRRALREALERDGVPGAHAAYASRWRAAAAREAVDGRPVQP